MSEAPPGRSGLSETVSQTAERARSRESCGGTNIRSEKDVMESEVSSLTSHEIAHTRFGIDQDDAQDLLQETALELLRQRTVVRSPGGFIFRVFHRRCCRFIRLRQADRRVFVPDAEPMATACDTALLEAADRQLTLRRVLETISSSCRRILLAYYVEGRTLKETAQAIPLPYPGVWNTISRCLRRLRACLE
jgi:RNA polymerase sigma factor (sigma-70 family)